MQKVLVAQSEIPKTNHEYNASYKVIKDATCTEKGTIRYYCICGKQRMKSYLLLNMRRL